MQTKEIISSILFLNCLSVINTYLYLLLFDNNVLCTVHKTLHRLSCYMNMPKYSKLFILIVRETSVTHVHYCEC